MGVRIIAGECRGRRLEVDDLPGLRPTTDRVRETIFNILAHRIDFEGLRVLDLFAGSGALGIEALSRGAGPVDFVEKNRRGADLIDRNLRTLGLQQRARVYREDVFRVGQRLGRYDLILADPPYGLAGVDRLVDLAADLLEEEGFFLLERGSATADPDPGRLALLADRTAGGTRILLYGN